MHATTPATDPQPQQAQGEYKAVVMDGAHEEDDKKVSNEEKLSNIQQLYKWARSGDNVKLKQFVKDEQQKREIDIKEFLSQKDDGSQDDVDTENKDGNKGFCGGDDEEEARPVFKPYRSGNTALHMAALHANREFCKDLFELGAYFSDVKNNLNSSPLHLAACSGDPETLAYILEKYVSGNSETTPVKEKNKIGNTPIHCAVYSNSVPCLKLLLEHCEKEDIDVKAALMERNHTGTQALRYAASQDMKVYINSIFNPNMADDEQKDDNDNNNENNISNDNNANEGDTAAANENDNENGNDTTQGNSVQEVDQ